MSQQTMGQPATGLRPPQRAPARRPGLRWGIGGAAVLVLLGAMALSTKVVSDKTAGAASDVFSPAEYGRTTFPTVQAAIDKRAVDAPVLAAAIAKDQQAAAKQYGTPTDLAPAFMVRFTGTVGRSASGIFPVAVPGVPVTVRLQTGPAITDTNVRDATGTIKFGQFHNQIEYQNAGAALNDQVKAQVLAGLDRAALPGKTVTVTGVFLLINPKNWLVTPVRLAVQ